MNTEPKHCAHTGTNCRQCPYAQKMAELEARIEALESAKALRKASKASARVYSASKMHQVETLRAYAAARMTLKRGQWTATQLAKMWDTSTDKGMLINISILCRDVWKLTCRRSGGDRLWVFDGRAL